MHLKNIDHEHYAEITWKPKVTVIEAWLKSRSCTNVKKQSLSRILSQILIIKKILSVSNLGTLKSPW